MALQKLRTAVGDGVFFHILRTWATEHRGGHGTTAQFIRLSERLSGKDLGALFHTWIGTAGKPTSP
jgi:aminopeptidase N